MRYRHTQVTNVFVLVVAALEAVALVFILLAGGGVAPLVATVALFGLVTAIAVVFGRLTVEIDDRSLRVSFGGGWPRREIQLGAVASARRVRNRWWYGFGIRKVPGGWLWNVWGLDSVELTLDTGKKFRVGTDEPDALLGALSGLVATG